MSGSPSSPARLRSTLHQPSAPSPRPLREPGRPGRRPRTRGAPLHRPRRITMGHEVPGAPDTEARRAPGLHEHRGDGVSEGRHQRLVGRQHHAGRAQPDGRRALGDGRQDHRRRPGAPRGARDPELVEPELLGTDRPREVPWRAVPSDSSIRVRYRFSRDTPGSVSISTDVPQWCAAARSSTHPLPRHPAGKGGKRWPLTSVDSWTCPSSPMSHRWIPLTGTT